MNNKYSQVGQDLFAIKINDNTPGFFIDIGCGKPNYINNTLLLREKKWKGKLLKFWLEENRDCL